MGHFVFIVSSGFQKLLTVNFSYNFEYSLRQYTNTNWQKDCSGLIYSILPISYVKHKKNNVYSKERDKHKLPTNYMS